jgi:hypothetical protein
MTGLLKTFIYKQTNRRKTDQDSDRPEDKRNAAINSAKVARAEVKVRIENMIAQLDYCGDRWFFSPKKSLDECFEDCRKNHKEGENCNG